MNQCAVLVVSTNRVFRPWVCLVLDMAQQLFAEAGVTPVLRYSQAGQFRRTLVGVGVHGDAATDALVVLQHGVAGDFHFQVLAAAPHQNVLFFQRSDQAQQVADVVEVGPSKLDQRVACDHAAHAERGEQFGQEGAVFVSAHQVGANHAFARGAHRMGM